MTSILKTFPSKEALAQYVEKQPGLAAGYKHRRYPMAADLVFGDLDLFLRVVVSREQAEELAGYEFHFIEFYEGTPVEVVQYLLPRQRWPE